MSVLRASAFALAALLPLAAAVPEPVRIESGQISGIQDSIRKSAFSKAYPSPRPPVGNLRWRSPKAAPQMGWRPGGEQVRHKLHAAAANGGGFPPNGGIRPEPGMSEDCLYLNVYTAAKSRQR